MHIQPALLVKVFVKYSNYDRYCGWSTIINALTIIINAQTLRMIIYTIRSNIVIMKDIIDGLQLLMH